MAAKKKTEEIPEDDIDPRDAFQARVNKAYKGTVIRRSGSVHEPLGMKRFSSGILSLDCALGGGWPFGRIFIIAGEESTGKTLLALKAAHEISNYDRSTRLHSSVVSPDKFEPCRTLLVDVEGAFDVEWAAIHGWDSANNLIAQPEYAEQAIDITTDAIRENIVDLIIIDSIAALAPIKEVEDSAEDAQRALGARLCNKAFRRWQGSLLRTLQSYNAGGPSIMTLNQYRIDLGKQYGDPRILPHGRAQKFASSITIFMSTSVVADDTKSEHGTGEFGGFIVKNKTFPPKRNFRFQMALADHDDWPAGQVNNDKELIDRGKQYGIIVKGEKKGWDIFGENYRVLTEITTKLETDSEFRSKLWAVVVECFRGARSTE